MSNNPIIAYIPARGGSKRILNKNRKLLLGKPIILHVIEVLQKLTWVEAICVSTDDPEIKEISDKAGAITLEFRDKELANDYCPFIDLLKKDFGRFEDYLNLMNTNYSVLFVLPTAALLDIETLENAKTWFYKSKMDFLFASSEYDISAFWAFKEEKNLPVALFPNKLLERSQDLPTTFCDAGLFYFLKSNFIVTAKDSWFTEKNITHFKVDKSIAIDVDTAKDWQKLEEKMLHLR